MTVTKMTMGGFEHDPATNGLFSPMGVGVPQRGGPLLHVRVDRFGSRVVAERDVKLHGGSSSDDLRRVGGSQSRIRTDVSAPTATWAWCRFPAELPPKATAAHAPSARPAPRCQAHRQTCRSWARRFDDGGKAATARPPTRYAAPTMSEQQDRADAPKAPGLPHVDVNEYGGKKDGEKQAMNRRLFMQLLVFDVPSGKSADVVATDLTETLRERHIPAVVYADVMDPRGIGLLTWSEDGARFVREVRPLFGGEGPLRDVALRPEFGMIGRTYATGHEPDLEYWLLRRPIENVSNDAFGWHVWYPLRRSGAFAKLDHHEQASILREHAQIGMAYGHQDLAHDVRLACHGLDAKDNEFLIGLIGRELHPLSHLVQTMRKTRQTSEYIVQMGPFFVGSVVARTG